MPTLTSAFVLKYIQERAAQLSGRGRVVVVQSFLKDSLIRQLYVVNYHKVEKHLDLEYRLDQNRRLALCSRII